MKKIIFFLLFVWDLTICAQSSELVSNHDFYSEQVVALNSWLTANDLSDSLITAKAIEISSPGVKLRMEVRDKLNWSHLNERSYRETGEAFYETLFEKFVFLGDLQRSQLEIEIEGMDSYIFITFENGSIAEDFMDKMGEISDNHKVPISSFRSLIGPGTFQTNQFSLDQIKKKIVDGMMNHFKPYKARFQEYRFQVLSQIDNELIFTISNVRNVVLDEGYFEHIRLTIDFDISPASIDLKYRIGAKYGAGIIWAPRRSDYRDMDPKYLDQLQDFNLIVKNLIDQLLKK